MQLLREPLLKLNLLVVTQRVDLESDLLGSFHHRLDAFSKSLGKERGSSRSRSALLFMKNTWRRKSAYDVALVHMTPIFVLLGWRFWRLGGKRIVFYPSSPSYSSRFARAKKMPAEESWGMGENEKKAHRLRFLRYVVEHHRLEVLAEEKRRELSRSPALRA
jgi:hypothetical protein